MSTLCLPEAGPSPTVGVPAVEAKPLVSTAHVQIRHTEIDELCPDDLMMLCWLRRLAFARGDTVKIVREDLQLKIGWTAVSYRPRSGAARVSRATARLTDHGLIIVHSHHEQRLQRTLNTYTVKPREEGRFEKVPLWLLDRLCAPELKGHGTLLLKHWLAWRKLCGASGTCQATIAEVAKTTGSGARATRKARQQLVDMGLLRSQDLPGFRSVTSVVGVVDLPAAAARSTARTPDSVTAAATPGGGDGAGPLSEILLRPGQDACSAPVAEVAHKREHNPLKTKVQHVKFGPKGRSRKQTREYPAGKPPSRQHEITSSRPTKSRDRFAMSARGFLRSCPQTSSLPGKTRGMLGQWLAAQLRRTPDRDLDQTFAALAHELAIAEESATERGRLYNHRSVMDQVLQRWFSDRIAAAPMPDDLGMALTAGGFDAPAWYVVGEGLEGPDLAELAGHDLPVKGLDPEDQVQACSVHLARLLLADLDQCAPHDVESRLNECRKRLHFQTGMKDAPRWLVAIAAKVVRAAWRVTYRRMLDTPEAVDAQEQDEAQAAARDWLSAHGIDPQSVLGPANAGVTSEDDPRD